MKRLTSNMKYILYTFILIIILYIINSLLNINKESFNNMPSSDHTISIFIGQYRAASDSLTSII